MPRRRIVFFKDLAANLRPSARRRESGPPRDANGPDRSTAEELERRLDETRERLRREIPPPEDE